MQYQALDSAFSALCQNLLDNGVLQKEIQEADFCAGVDMLLDALRERYPDTKLKRMMRSVHYANGFADQQLKEAAYKLDEIEQHLCINGLLDHDELVEYYNSVIVQKQVGPEALVETMLESLWINREG